MSQGKKKLCKRIAGALTSLIVAVLFFTLGCRMTAYAADEGQLSGQIVTLSEDVEAYNLPDFSSQATKLKAGDVVLVTDETSDYTQIYYQGTTLYVNKQSGGIPTEGDEKLAEEMEKQAQIDKSWIESYVTQMKGIRAARVWKIAIVVLIVAVVAVVVFKSVSRKDPDKGKAE